MARPKDSGGSTQYFSIPDFISELVQSEEWSPYVRDIIHTDSREATTGFPLFSGTDYTVNPFHPRLREKLKEMGINTLFKHQAEAFDLAQSGKDVLVTTGTNSGKSLCYNLPALQKILDEPAARVLYLFPTKALAHDQANKLNELRPGEWCHIGEYDGDTPARQRASIRKSAHIIISNPDMLHLGILPNHEHWSSFFKSLRLIVIDEIHAYRGIFGSHFANVLQRLLLMCEWHHSRPQIIAASATIGNPTEAFKTLTGRDCSLISGDTSDNGERTLMFLSPLDEAETAVPANILAGRLTARLVSRGAKVLTFNRSRQGAELCLRYARKALSEIGGNESTIESYRAGYTAKERKSLEAGLFSAEIRGLSATNAMELGVDIGELDAVVVNGYPGTISSFWQQIGRAGRGNQDGLAIYLAHEDPLEQHLCREPKMLLSRTIENLCVKPQNEYILGSQLLCAAYERPFTAGDILRFGQNAPAVADDLVQKGELQFSADRYYYASFSPPAKSVSIRGVSLGNVDLILDGVIIGTMDRSKAFASAFPGAIYMHRNQDFEVTSLDLEMGVAQLALSTGTYWTVPFIESQIATKVEIAKIASNSYEVHLCGMNVEESIRGFEKRTFLGQKTEDFQELTLPPQSFDTVGIKFCFPSSYVTDVEDRLAGVHGAEHALVALAPLFAGCDSQDLGNSWNVLALSENEWVPQIEIFDRVPGGIGLSEKLFEIHQDWLSASIDLLLECDCVEGCPRCLFLSRCNLKNHYLSKPFAIECLRELITNLNVANGVDVDSPLRN